jgi:hypothetical protein
MLKIYKTVDEKGLFREINKSLSNEYLDAQYKLKVDEMEKIVEEHMSKINNLFN